LKDDRVFFYFWCALLRDHLIINKRPEQGITVATVFPLHSCII